MDPVEIKNDMTSTMAVPFVISQGRKLGYKIIKRIFDIIVGIIGLIFLLPMTIVVKAINILSGDFKSIFYSQIRIGKDGKNFKLFKFRSMVPNADEELKKLLENNKDMAEEYRINKKLKNDPRITKSGKILRRLSLDEWPQFINVLIGNMSLIGNRPYLPREKNDMGGFYDEIVKTKPGITGYWQVSGRSNLSFIKRLQLERFYSKNASFRMDIKILFKTFKVVLFGLDAK
jgi:lipopolysaccharide/colanic/teichoic acid biosynthesis glycosyltransferase